MPRKTKDVMDELDIPDHVIRNMLRFRKLHPAPETDSSGDFVWTDEDVERLRLALAARRPRRAATAV